MTVLGRVTTAVYSQFPRPLQEKAVKGMREASKLKNIKMVRGMMAESKQHLAKKGPVQWLLSRFIPVPSDKKLSRNSAKNRLFAQELAKRLGIDTKA